MLPRSHLGHSEQERPDTAIAISGMDAEKGRDPCMLFMPDTGKTNTLSSGCDYDPGVIGQVKVWSLPLGKQFLQRAARHAILAILTQTHQFGDFHEIFGIRMTRHEIFE